MSDIKISQLPTTSSLAAGDLIPVVAVSGPTTKAITKANLRNALGTQVVTVANDTARFALTSSNVNLGDFVVVTASGYGTAGSVYTVIDLSNLGNNTGYTILGVPTGANLVLGTMNFDSGNITSDGNGNLSIVNTDGTNGNLSIGDEVHGFGGINLGGILLLNTYGGGEASFAQGKAAISNTGALSFDSGGIYSDGEGDLTVGGSIQVSSQIYNVYGAWDINGGGAVIFDNGAFTSDGSGNLLANSFAGTIRSNTFDSDVFSCDSSSASIFVPTYIDSINTDSITGDYFSLGSSLSFDTGAITTDGRGNLIATSFQGIFIYPGSDNFMVDSSQNFYINDGTNLGNTLSDWWNGLQLNSAATDSNISVQDGALVANSGALINGVVIADGDIGANNMNVPGNLIANTVRTGNVIIGDGDYGDIADTSGSWSISGDGGFSFQYGNVAYGGDAGFSVNNKVFFDNGAVFTDGSGNFTVDGLVTASGGLVVTGQIADSGGLWSINSNGYGNVSFDGGATYTDGGGNIYMTAGCGITTHDSVYGIIVGNSGQGWDLSSPTNSWQIQHNGSLIFDTGAITSDGSGNLTTLSTTGIIYLTQAATTSAPTYVKGAMYFDTTLNKLRIGGATGWETVTSV